MNRRDFIRIGSTATLGIAGVLNARTWRASGPELFVGFAEATQFIDARNLAGDPQFLRDSVSVTVTKTVSPLLIDALYVAEIDGVRRDVPFSATGSGRAASRFKMPVDPVEGIAFAFHAPGATYSLRFSVHSAEGVLPLRRGTYVALLRNTAPDWRAMQIDELPEDAIALTFDYTAMTSR